MMSTISWEQKKAGREELRQKRRETNKKWFIAELAMTSQVACLSLCHVGHLWSCCVTPSYPGRLLWGINTPMRCWCICTSGLCYQVPLGSYWKNQGLHGSHCFGPRHGSCCSFDSGGCNDSHVKAGTSVVGGEVGGGWSFTTVTGPLYPAIWASGSPGTSKAKCICGGGHILRWVSKEQLSLWN